MILIYLVTPKAAGVNSTEVQMVPFGERTQGVVFCIGPLLLLPPCPQVALSSCFNPKVIALGQKLEGVGCRSTVGHSNLEPDAPENRP